MLNKLIKSNYIEAIPMIQSVIASEQLHGNLQQFNRIRLYV